MFCNEAKSDELVAKYCTAIGKRFRKATIKQCRTKQVEYIAKLLDGYYFKSLDLILTVPLTDKIA